MTRKISLGAVVALIIISICLSSATSIFVVLNYYSKLISELPQKAEQYIRLSEIDELLRREYYGVLDMDFVEDQLAEGYVAGLNDPYSFYISSSDFDEYNDYLQGKIYGIGVTAFYDRETGYLKVSYVELDSPAEKAGIKSGYYITSVNGNTVTESNSAQLLSVLTAGYNKNAEISYISADTDDAPTVVIEIPVGYEKTSCFYELHSDIGYIRIADFTQKTSVVFSEALNYFVAEGTENIIIDLRNCAGNSFDIAAGMIDMIVPVGSEGSGLLYSAKNYNGDIVSSYSSDAAAVNCNFVVLINSKTQSAAELFAVDLSDFGKAVLIGEKTAGNGKMQKLFPLSDGSAVYLTVAKIYPYISDSFDEVGIEPDILSESDSVFESQLDFREFANDHQYQAAVSYFSNK